MLTFDFENWVLKYLEGRLVLRVDKMKMAIHSVVSENIRCCLDEGCFE